MLEGRSYTTKIGFQNSCKVKFGFNFVLNYLFCNCLKKPCELYHLKGQKSTVNYSFTSI